METSETERIVMEDLDGGFVLVDFEETLAANDGNHEELLSDDDEDELSYTNSVTLTLTPEFPRKRWAVNIPPREQRIKDVIKLLVLTYLPAKSVCRFRAVSKDWNSWISAPFFAHEQSLRFTKISGLFSQFPGENPSFTALDWRSSGVPIPSLSFLPERVEVRATNGGLLCCRSHLGSYYICNPATKQWTKLPEPNMYHGPETALGLTFEPSPSSYSANYQLVCAVVAANSSTIDDDDEDRLVVVSFEVYSSRSGEWRVCDAMYCDGDLGTPEFVGDGLYLNGFVHWETGGGKVLTFDVKNEDCGVINLPLGHGPQGSLGVMNGELCYLLPSIRGGEVDVEEEGDGALQAIWSPVIEVYGDMDMKLKRVINVNYGAGEFCGRALALVGDKVVIAVFGNKVVAYDVEAEKGEWIGNAREDGFEKFLPYVNSLVDVKVAGSGDMVCAW
ncbi:unnamed protein product [Linum trigynum]|uniref:F-box domain-containing protein n=1 Tax=Linum trigynum TaxID=586398 RepID=A0AAV2DSX0_9ROSI